MIPGTQNNEDLWDFFYIQLGVYNLSLFTFSKEYTNSFWKLLEYSGERMPV